MPASATATEAVRITVVGSLLCAAYLTAVCPCEPLIGCHKAQWYAAIALPLLLISYGLWAQ